MVEARDRIKVIREYCKLSQVDFAKKIPISNAYISQLETGERRVTERMLKFISKEFGVNLEWLRYGTGDMLESGNILELVTANIDSLDDMDKKILSEYVKLNARNRMVIKAYIKSLL